MIHFAFYVPLSDAEKVKNALFVAGAGEMGNYDHCSFETKGLGQYRPLKGSNPAIGQLGILETVEELKVEMVFEDLLYPQIVAALIESHPYETPAYYGTKTLG
jgi:hypothetical protein